MQAIQKMPSDFALSEAKFYMKLALERISKVENKRFKREQLAMAENADKAKPITWEIPSDEEGARILQNLDSMIDEEKGRLDQIKEKKTTKTTRNQTFLG